MWRSEVHCRLLTIEEAADRSTSILYRSGVEHTDLALPAKAEIKLDGSTLHIPPVHTYTFGERITSCCRYATDQDGVQVIVKKFSLERNCRCEVAIQRYIHKELKSTSFADLVPTVVHAVRAHDAGLTRGQRTNATGPPQPAYLVMEHVAGRTFANRMNTEFLADSPDLPMLAAQVLLNVAIALENLQSRCEFVHGDLHPGNVIVRDDLKVHIIDFGNSTIAKTPCQPYGIKFNASSDLMQLILHCYANYDVFEEEITRIHHVMRRDLPSDSSHYVHSLNTKERAHYAAWNLAREMRQMTWDGSLDKHGLFSPRRVAQKCTLKLHRLSNQSKQASPPPSL